MQLCFIAFFPVLVAISIKN